MFEDESECFFVNVINEIIEEGLLAVLSNDPSGTCLFYGNLRLFDL